MSVGTQGQLISPSPAVITKGRRGRGLHMNQSIAFAATCPRCTHKRIQDDYTRGTLLRSLELGLPIEGYCVVCDRRWIINKQERVAVTEKVVASLSTTPSPGGRQQHPL
jgi:hypothetical protein